MNNFAVLRINGLASKENIESISNDFKRKTGIPLIVVNSSVARLRVYRRKASGVTTKRNRNI